MKHHFLLLLGGSFIAFAACNKPSSSDIQPAASADFRSFAKGGSGSSGGSGGGPTSTGIIQSFVQGGASRLVATRPDSMLVVFNSAVPATGYTLTFTSS